MTREELLKEIEKLEELVAQVSAHTDVYPALRAVVELHKPFVAQNPVVTHDGYATVLPCAACFNTFPCPTIQAIEKELAW